MSVDRTLERTDPDWALYVADFPADTHGDGFCATRLHIRPTARLKVEQQTSNQGVQVWVGFGPHCWLFIPHAMAGRLRELLDQLFSAGATVDVVSPPPQAPSADALTGETSAAPAEPSWNQFPNGGLQ